MQIICQLVKLLHKNVIVIAVRILKFHVFVCSKNRFSWYYKICIDSWCSSIALTDRLSACDVSGLKTELFGKKSRSTCSLLIWRLSLSVCFSNCLLDFKFLSKMSPVPSSSERFHTAIMMGWTPIRATNSAVVISFLKAASANLALNFWLYFFFAFWVWSDHFFLEWLRAQHIVQLFGTTAHPIRVFKSHAI